MHRIPHGRNDFKKDSRPPGKYKIIKRSRNIPTINKIYFLRLRKFKHICHNLFLCEEKEIRQLRPTLKK